MKFAASALTLALFGILQVKAASIAISPASLTVSTETFSLNVDISNVVDLYAFQFNLQFQPDLLSATSVTEGGFLSAGGSTIFIPGTIDNSAGFVSFAGDTLVGPVSGVNESGTLATINFNAVSPGTSSVTLFDPILLDSQLFSISADPISGSSVTIQAAAVPEPENRAFILLLLGTVLICPSLRARLAATKDNRNQQ
jgi:adhesin HecA-like repeat protein